MDSLPALYDFKCMHNLMIPTENSICPTLLLNTIYHMIELPSCCEWG